MPSGLLTVASAIEKNKIASTVTYVELLEISVRRTKNSAVEEILRIANNPEDVVYKGNTYTYSYFSLNLERIAGSTPEIPLEVFDPTGALEERIQNYSGGLHFGLVIKWVRSDALNEEPEVEETLKILKTESADFKTTFTLGVENPLSRRCPRRVQFKESCSWLYKSKECGYTGSMTECDYTMTGSKGCRIHNNSRRYGGFPGIINR